MPRNWNPFRKESPVREQPLPIEQRSFTTFTQAEIDAVCACTHFGTFELTGAVHPHPRMRLEEGYRFDTYRNPEDGSHVPALMVNATREKLWPLFYDLLYELGEEVDVVLETSHHKPGSRHHADLYRQGIDRSVLHSTLLDFEETLLTDGCAGVAALNPEIPLEVQFDEHKVIVCYGNDLRRFVGVCLDHRISHKPGMKVVGEDEHLHSSSDNHEEQFLRLATRMGFGDDDTEEAAAV